MIEKSPLLTDTQRELLEQYAGGEVELSDHSRTRSRMRSRVRSILKEFPFLFATLPKKDREAIFDGIDEYREESREAKEADGLTLEKAGSWPPGRVRPTDLTFTAEEGEEVYWGVVANLAFLFAGVGDTSEFEHHLEQAIKGARRDQGRLPLNVDVDIDISEETVSLMTIGMKRRKIPGGGWTPLMDSEVFEEQGIGDMSEEELRELFGEGFPKGNKAIYDGESVLTPYDEED